MSNNKYSFESMPQLRLLKNHEIEQIHEEALKILEKSGVFFDSKEALDILEEAGCSVDFERQIARIPRVLVEKSIASTPGTLKLYDREGAFYSELGGNNVNFYPGSCPKNILENDGISVRPSTSADMRLIAKVAQNLQQIDFVSTSVVCNDAPMELGDQYIYYNVIKNSTKPIIGGAVDIPGVARTFELLKAIRGSEKEAREKPYTVFDICPASPLRWSDISSQNIIDCARMDIPIEFISAIIVGIGSPVTLAGSILQHTAETLSGITLAQIIKPGIPIVYGGAPCVFNMRTMYSPMAALESNMITCGYALMGKYYGLPTHTYAALSDSKVIDYQAGSESTRSALLVAQAGVNNISGAGGLDIIGQQSVEKLVMDADVIGMVKHFIKGISVTEDSLACELINEIGPGGEFLGTEHTMRWFRQEHYIDSKVLDCNERAKWERDGKISIFDRAKAQIEIIKQQPDCPLDAKRSQDLDQAFLNVCEDAQVSSFASQVIGK